MVNEMMRNQTDVRPEQACIIKWHLLSNSFLAKEYILIDRKLLSAETSSFSQSLAECVADFPSDHHNKGFISSFPLF